MRTRNLARLGLAGLAAVFVSTSLLASACTPGPPADPPAPALRPVPRPALTAADRGAQQQLDAAYSAIADTSATAQTLGDRYGALGRLLMAAELDDAAEPALLNAQALAPRARWTYYLAHVYRRRGDMRAAVTSFERTLDRTPADVATIWWLGTVSLGLGRTDEAERRFSQALTLQPGALSAVYGLGRTALARRDFTRAVEHFERVLVMNPRATAAHYPLGLAYRGLGQMDRAATHLARRTHVAIVPIDPLMNELDELLQSVTAYQDRGMRAARSGDWGSAVRYFQQAVAVAPEDGGARLDLSAALAHTGDQAGAIAQAREAARLMPDETRAREWLASLRVRR